MVTKELVIPNSPCRVCTYQCLGVLEGLPLLQSSGLKIWYDVVATVREASPGCQAKPRKEKAFRGVSEAVQLELGVFQLPSSMLRCLGVRSADRSSVEA